MLYQHMTTQRFTACLKPEVVHKTVQSTAADNRNDLTRCTVSSPITPHEMLQEECTDSPLNFLPLLQLAMTLPLNLQHQRETFLRYEQDQTLAEIYNGPGEIL